jgi:hypothetical protein
METDQNNTDRPRPARARHSLRFGLLTAACLGAIGVAAGSAQAIGLGFGDSPVAPGIAVADDGSFTLSNPDHSNRFDDSFSVHQYGALYSATARNSAMAESVACAADKPCRSVSLSFQIVTMAGTDIRLDADNTSHSQNVHCDGCQTLAGAYQFVVSTPRPFTLSASALSQLAQIHRELNALGASTAPVSDIKQQVDALADQVTVILKAAAATAPAGPGVNALAQMEPQVTVHGVFDQN